MNFKLDLLDEDVSVRWQNRHFLELQHAVVGKVGAALSDEVGVQQRPLVLALLQLVEHGVEFVDETGVAGQVLQLLVRQNQLADGLRQVDQQRRVADVVTGDSRCVALGLGKVGFAASAEHRHAQHQVAAVVRAVLDEHRIEDAHPELLFDDVEDVAVQLLECRRNSFELPVASVVKRDFFGMRQDVEVLASVLAFELLSDRCERPERRRHIPENAYHPKGS